MLRYAIDIVKIELVTVMICLFLGFGFRGDCFSLSWRFRNLETVLRKVCISLYKQESES